VLNTLFESNNEIAEELWRMGKEYQAQAAERVTSPKSATGLRFRGSNLKRSDDSESDYLQRGDRKDCATSQ
jgi:hypothetical protein